MQQSSAAIVLSRLKYKDSDLIVKCFTKDFGIKSYIIKGVLKSKKRRITPAYFQALSILEIQAHYKNNRTLHYINDIKVKQHYKSVYTNVIKSTVAIFLSEILNDLLVEETPNLELYNFIETTLIWFDENDSYSYFHYVFLIELTKYLGFYPELSNIDSQYFNLLDGRFSNQKPHNYYIDGENLTLLKTLLGIKFDRNKTFVINANQRQEFLDMILSYFKLHLEGFKTPKSLAVMNQVFR